MDVVLELAAQFETEYARYLEEMDALKKRISHVRLAHVIFSRQNPFNDDSIHARFREILAELCDKLETAASHNTDPLIASAACERVTGLLLGQKDSNDITYWPLVACEGFALPLISFISPQRLVGLYADYHAINPQNRCLPNQAKIKKAIKARLQSSGLWNKKR